MSGSDGSARTRGGPAARARARPQRRGVAAHPRNPRPHADLLRAGHLLGDVVGALFATSRAACICKNLPTTGRARPGGAGRRRRRRRDRRRPRGDLQDREPQPPVVHRADPGRGDRRGRHPARHLLDGRAPDRVARLDPLRPARRSQTPAPARGRGARHRRLRQLGRRRDRRRRDQLPRVLPRQHPGERVQSRTRSKPTASSSAPPAASAIR